MSEKRLVAVGISKKGESRFKMTTEVNLRHGENVQQIPVEYKHEKGVHSIVMNYGNLINGSAIR